MSIGPRIFHGDEVKCAGAPTCTDCQMKKELQSLNVLSLKFTPEEFDAMIELLDRTPPSKIEYTIIKDTICLCPHCEFHNKKY